MVGGNSTVTVVQKSRGVISRANSDILMELVGNYEEISFDRDDHDQDANKISVDPAVTHVSGGVAAAVLGHPAAHQGMTTHRGESLKRDTIVILRMDGEDLLEFIHSSRFKQVMKLILSTIPDQTSDIDSLTLGDYVTMALQQLTIDHGMPPPSDSWVISNIIEPALQQYCVHENIHDQEERVIKRPFSKEKLLKDQFKKVIQRIAQRLKQEPVIVAHIQNTFDGSGIKRLLSNKSELDKALDTANKELLKDEKHKVSSKKEYLFRVALDGLGPITGLPPNGAVDEVDEVVNEVLKILVNKEDDNMAVVIQEEEEEEMMKKLMREMLRRIMLELEAKPISISSNFVIHEPL